MAKIRRYAVDNDIEKRIVTGLIVSDEFCTSIQKMIKIQYFQIDYARIIVGWIQEHFKTYKKSPGKNIQDIYKGEKDSLSEADSNLIGKFLSNLSAEYEESSSFNHNYLLDQARDYFRERSLSILSEKIQSEILKGKIDQAETEVKNFSRVVKELGTWVNPFEKSSIYKIFSGDNDFVLSLPDELGDLSGDLERGWLVAFMGPMKRGKSWMLQEFAIQALSCNLKVVFFSLEMSEKEVSKRIYKRLTGMSDKAGRVSWPTFDCERNQDNTCRKPERTSPIGVKAPGDIISEYREVKGYKPCVVCRVKGQENGDYRQAVWHLWKDQKEGLDAKNVLKKARNFDRLYGNNFRVKSYPSFMASFDNIISDLDDLWYTEGFAPDVICIDSIDIMAPDNNRNLSERGAIDSAWKRAKGLGGERHCIVASVLQSNRASITQKSVQQDNTSEDIRKLAHVDIMFGLNQTPEEKKRGVLRISTVAHRHKGFQFGRDVMVLQSLDLGQPLMETQWAAREEKD